MKCMALLALLVLLIGCSAPPSPDEVNKLEAPTGSEYIGTVFFIEPITQMGQPPRMLISVMGFTEQRSSTYFVEGLPSLTSRSPVYRMGDALIIEGRKFPLVSPGESVE